jgi:hypothetical protein
MKNFTQSSFPKPYVKQNSKYTHTLHKHFTQNIYLQNITQSSSFPKHAYLTITVLIRGFLSRVRDVGYSSGLLPSVVEISLFFCLISGLIKREGLREFGMELSYSNNYNNNNNNNNNNNKRLLMTFIFHFIY